MGLEEVEPECLRITAALDLAEELGVPLEWFALSAGAKIAMATNGGAGALFTWVIVLGSEAPS